MIRAEWTRFRTARGWMIGMLVSGVLTALLGPLLALGNHASCGRGEVEEPCPAPPTGPGGQAVTDRLFFMNRQLDGDGSITVRVGPMTGRIKEPPPPGTVGPGPVPVPGVVPWAKAGIMIKKAAEQGAAYAAVMTTSEHGVRMQHDFTEDIAGSTGNRWLRLTRESKTITGYESPDGRRWTRIATAELEGPARIGLFAASPGDLTVERKALGTIGSAVRFAEVTATFDQLGLQGAGGEWSRDDIGVQVELDGKTPHHPGGVVQSGDTYTLTGVGDIAPLLDGGRIEQTLSGLIAGLVVVIVVAVLFVSSERRRVAGRVLMAKVAVIAAISAVTGLVAAAVAVTLGTRILESNGNHLLPVSLLTEVRVMVGVALLYAAVAVLALALGALFRSRVAGIATAVALVVLPYGLGTALALPDWLFRFTPAAGFSVLQSIPAYPQVLGNFVPAMGFYPLPPWVGAAVLCCYAALALGLAVRRIQRKDVAL